MSKKKVYVPAGERVFPSAENTKDINRFIGLIAQICRAIERIQHSVDSRILKIKEKAASQVREREERIAAIFSAIFTFMQTNRLDLTGQGRIKTIKYPNGQVKWYFRKTALVIPDEDAAVAELKALGRDDLVRTTETIRKDLIFLEPDLIAKMTTVNLPDEQEIFSVEPDKATLSFFSEWLKKKLD
ncbi:MAG: bacteriophage Mu Gam like protein [uncultured bacterium]|nr:MAG: bacteriophage Mu Gam like protein [uncultured bacterium]